MSRQRQRGAQHLRELQGKRIAHLSRHTEIGFIDDAEANIEAARQFGWKAMQWTSISKLQDAVAAFSA